MRNPLRTLIHWTTRTTLSLLVIITMLLGYNFLSAEYAKFEKLEDEQSVLDKVTRDLESVRDQFAKELPARLPQPGAPLPLLAERIQLLESEIGRKQGIRQNLWNAHPFERKVPASSAFMQIAALDIEMAFLQQGLVHVRNLHSYGAGPAEAERQIKGLQASSHQLAIQIYQSKRAQWELSQAQRLMWQLPFTPAYREMKRLEAQERSLQLTKDQADAETVRQQGILTNLQKLPRPGPLVLDHALANRAIQPVHDRMAENRQQLETSTFAKFFRPVKDVLPSALWILALALLSPLLAKAIAYYLIAPVAASCQPLRLLPESSGRISTRRSSIPPTTRSKRCTSSRCRTKRRWTT